MGKSRAEIQRDYRKRKLEKEGENFKQKERERAKKYYVPIADRSKKDVKLRREKVRLLVKKHRDKKRTESELMRLQVEENTTQNTTDREAVDITEDENQVSSTVTESGSQHQGLVVRLPFSSPKGRNVRKRISRVAARQSREIKKLREENTKLQRKYKTVCKRYERKTKALHQHPAAASSSTEGFSSLNSLTPSKRTAHELRSCGVSPSKLPKRVLKKLVLSNVVTDEVRAARNNTGIKGKKLINQIISGAIVKKYRMGRTLASRFRMKRQNLLSNTKRCTVNMKRRYRAFHEKAKAAVETFLSRDDNSRQMPGKSDFKRVHNEQKQRRILSDSMKNLFFKYSSENEECKMSFPTFCRLRPHHIALTKYLSKNNCLCQRHQNMALLLKSLKSMNANVPLNPEDYVRKVTESGPDSYLSEVTEEEVPFQQWQKVECQDGKKRMKIVEKKISKQAFIELFQKNTAEFVAHCDRIKQQYKALQDLKEGLPENHIILQMDFAENFACSSADEVQSAYWNCCLVTLHPVVMYYKSVSGQLLHKSYVLVSDDIGHNAGTVYAFLKELLQIIQEDMGDVKWVHYWTDSPSSQYRNKTIFYLVSDHHSLFGMQASWNYFESGHGKGPCDGIGGTSKRMADLAVRQRKVTIQDAREYFAWGAKYHTTSRYVLVEGSRITPIRQELQELIRSVIPLKGTMKIHAVASLSYGVIRNRTTSCYCNLCLRGDYHTDWITSSIVKDSRVDLQGVDVAEQPDEAVQRTPPDTTENPLQDHPVVTEQQDLSEANQGTPPVERENLPQLQPAFQAKEGEYVAAMYEGQWYIGRTEGVDMEDMECLVSFMEKVKSGHFRWPRSADEIWVPFREILCAVGAPRPCGRSCRTFKVDEVDLEIILQKYDKHV